MHLKRKPALNCYAEKDITMDNGQLQEKPDVLSSIQGLRKLVKADSLCICFVFFVSDSVVFRPYCKYQRGLELYSFG